MHKLLFIALVALFSFICQATISLESRLFFDKSGEDNSCSLFVDIANTGDESANDVELVSMLGDKEALRWGTSIIRPSNSDVEPIPPMELAKNSIVFTNYNCCAYPILLRYKDRNGHSFSSVLIATCAFENHKEILKASTASLMLSSACVEESQSVSALAISAIYDYEKAIALGAKKIRFCVYFPEGVNLAEKSTDICVDINENGMADVTAKITKAIENMSGDIPYAVIVRLCDAEDNFVSPPVYSISMIRINAPLDLKQFPQLLNKTFLAGFALVVLVLLVISIVRANLIKKAPAWLLSLIEWLIVAGITTYLFFALQLPLALKGYTCMGGDLPAHHYLVGHIAETMLPVTWADGWWCGFPMFHYYFPLPYYCLAMLSKLFPHNVVFNLGVCAGMLLLPLSVYMSCRIARMPRPLPIMATCFVLPLLFDNTHNMWGVNAYSTLAGMVANSWSFCLLLPAAANLYRDTVDNRLRLRTPILIAMVALSHFFTSIVFALVVGVLWLMLLFICIKRKTTNYRVPLIEGVIGVLLVAWWLVPLMATGEWSVAFGSQWEIHFFKQLPNIIRYFFCPSLILCFVVALVTREKVSIELWAWFGGFAILFCVALLLFSFGRSIAEVFVNCRLWPFIAFALMFLMAGLLAIVFRRLPISGTLLVLALCFAYAWNDKADDKNEVWSYLNLVPSWAKYNFSGYENSLNGSVGQEIIDYLRSVEPCGRIAYDLHPYNESLGSTRFFESLPALTGHSIIEGGIVNSAIGSLPAYVVQGEMSETTAGWPLLVKPRSFNPELGLAHLELMGVRRFIAHSDSTIDALVVSPRWHAEKVFDGKWVLFKHRDETSGLVRKWNKPLGFYTSENFQLDALEWLYVGGATDEPFVLIDDNDRAMFSTLNEPQKRLEELKGEPTPVGDWINVISEEIPSKIIKKGGRYEIHFSTEALNQPHIVAMSYFPNWKTRGATGPCFVTPGFMVVYPTEENVVLYYGVDAWNILGYCLTILGIIYSIILLMFFRAPVAMYDNNDGNIE